MEIKKYSIYIYDEALSFFLEILHRHFKQCDLQVENC